MTSPTSTAGGRRRAAAPGLLLAAMVLVALNLRAPITSVPPLLLTIAADLDLGGAAAGLLTTLPVLCMGLFAPPAQALAHWLGREGAITWALGLLFAGTLLRLGGGAAPVLFLAVLLAGVGIAIAGTLLPGVVKEHYAERSGAVTGVYMAGMMVAASLASQLAVPLADALGSWQASLAAWSVLAVLGLTLWLPVTRHARDAHVVDTETGPGRLPWRSSTAWLLAGYLVCNSWEFYTQVAWIPATYEDLGRSPAAAGGLLTAFIVAQAVSGIGGPALADRVPDLRALLLPCVGVSVVATAGVAYAPEAAPVLWMVLLGLGLGGGFALGLVLLVHYAVDPVAAARLTAMVFLVSYTVSSVGPVVFGAMRDAAGDVVPGWTVLVVIAVAQAGLVLRLSPRRAPVR